MENTLNTFILSQHSLINDAVLLRFNFIQEFFKDVENSPILFGSFGLVSITKVFLLILRT